MVLSINDDHSPFLKPAENDYFPIISFLHNIGGLHLQNHQDPEEINDKNFITVIRLKHSKDLQEIDAQ